MGLANGSCSLGRGLFDSGSSSGLVWGAGQKRHAFGQRAVGVRFQETVRQGARHRAIARVGERFDTQGQGLGREGSVLRLCVAGAGESLVLARAGTRSEGFVGAAVAAGCTVGTSRASPAPRFRREFAQPTLRRISRRSHRRGLGSRCRCNRRAGNRPWPPRHAPGCPSPEVFTTETACFLRDFLAAAPRPHA